MEWQLEALDLRPVERWIAARALDATPKLEPRPTLSIVDTYLDTDDWRLHRAGFSLRLRQHDTAVEAEATLKSLSPAGDGLRERREIGERLAKADAGLLARARGPVGERLRALAAKRSLQVLLEVRTTRRRFGVIDGDAEVGELTLDHTAIPVDGDDLPVVLQRVEIEWTGGPREPVDRLAHAVRIACGLRPAATSKFEAGLLARGLAPPAPPDLGPTHVDARTSVGELAFASLRSQFLEVLAHEPGARLGEDPEEVHDMRVATRRMRAAIALFETALPARARWLRRELGWIARSLGAVRDLDVQIEQVERWVAEGEPDDARGFQPLLKIMEKRRRQARRRLIRGLDSKRFERLTVRSVEMLRRGPLPRSLAAREPVVETAPALLAKPYRRVRRDGDRLVPSSPPAEFHALRIRCKRLRYALEFLSPVAPRETKAFAKRLAALQDVLGEHQDAQVAMEHIHELALEPSNKLDAHAVFALGRVAERYERQAADLRERFRAAYRDVRGGEWRDVERALARTRQERRAAAARAPRRPVPGPVA